MNITIILITCITYTDHAQQNALIVKGMPYTVLRVLRLLRVFHTLRVLRLLRVFHALRV